MIGSFLLFKLECLSQANERVHLAKYTQRDGLPSYNVRKVMQDSKGFIWLGTQDGLSRFDGYSFINYSKNASAKYRICGVDVREIIEDSTKKLLWVLPGEIGLNAIDLNTGQVVLTAPIPNTDIENWNISMAKVENTLWIGTSTGIKIYDISKNTYEERIPLPRPAINSTDFETRSIQPDIYGNIWACYSGYGIVIYNGRTREIIKQIPNEKLGNIKNNEFIRFFTSTLGSKGEVYFGTSIGLRKINYSVNYDISIENTPCNIYPAFNSESVSFLKVNHQHELLISGFDKMIEFDQSLKHFKVFQEPQKPGQMDWFSSVQYIFEDHDDNLWIGCEEGLAFINKYTSPFKPYSYDKNSNITLDHVRSIFPQPNGDILAGLSDGIVEISTANSSYKKYDPGHLYHHIFLDKIGHLVVSRPDGMFIYGKGFLTPIQKIYPEFSGFENCPINSHLEINDSTIVFGSENDNGILIWNPNSRNVRKISQNSGKAHLYSSIVNNIYLDKNRNIWVLSDNVISILSPDLKTIKELVLKNRTDLQPYKLFFDMCESDGFYWIASYGSGILQLDYSFRVINNISSKNGLSNDGVYQIYSIQIFHALAFNEQVFLHLQFDAIWRGFKLPAILSFRKMD